MLAVACASCRGPGQLRRTAPGPDEQKALDAALAPYLAGDHRRAEEELSRFLNAYAASPLESDALCWRGLSRLKTGKLDEAISDLQASLKLPSTGAVRAAATKGVADVLFASRKYMEARKAYLGTVAECGEFLQTDRLLLQAAICDLRMAKWDNAHAEMKQIRDRFPGTESAARADEILGEGLRHFTAQCGAFAQEKSALELERRLSAGGYRARVEKGQKNDRAMYRVRVGQFRTETEAEDMVRRIRGDGFDARVAP